jgi:hypothetical protein
MNLRHLVLIALVALGLTVVGAQARAGFTPVAPGGTVSPATSGAFDTSGKTLIETIGPTTLNAPSGLFSGTVSEEVWKTNSTGHFSFLYQISSSSGSSRNITNFIAQNYGGVGTEVGFATNSGSIGTFSAASGSGTGASSVSRSIDGNNLTFFFSGSGLTKGSTSKVLVIETDAFGFDNNGAIQLSGQNIPGKKNAGSVTSNNWAEPDLSATPEPNSLVLLGIGLPVLGTYAWRRVRARKTALAA